MNNIYKEKGFKTMLTLDEAKKMTFGDMYKYFRKINEEQEQGNAEKGGNNEAEVKEFISYLKNIDGIDNLLNTLNNLKPEQLAKLKSAYGNGEYAEHIEVSKPTPIDVLKLIPTQNEIDVENSLAYPLKCEKPETPDQIKEILSNKPVTVKEPIVVYNDGSNFYIIDGHHRWSQVYLLNVNAKIVAYVFNGSAGEKKQGPVDVLRDFQGAVTVANDKPISHSVEEGRNIFDWSDDQIKTYVVNNTSDACLKVFKDFFKKDVTKEMVADRVLGNAHSMQQHNKPIAGAPDRTEMPQTGEKNALQIAMKGMSDI